MKLMTAILFGVALVSGCATSKPIPCTGCTYAEQAAQRAEIAARAAQAAADKAEAAAAKTFKK